MTDRSFEKFDYGLRPNKNVERKMIFRSLRELDPHFAVSAYRYAGLGSLWFVDLVLAHRELGITDLVTMEREESREKRVEFNRPFGCIRIFMESASDALPKFIDAKRTIVWLDYDGPLSAALSGDLEIALGKLPAGSFILTTVNAEVFQLERKDEDGNAIPYENTLAEITEDKTWEQRGKELNRRDFPRIVASVILDRMKSIVLNFRPGLEFTPIWNFSYADDARMVTVGGMIGDEACRVLLDRAGLPGRLEFITGETQYPIELPVLTVREKREFDRRLPSGVPIKISDLPFELRTREIEAYQKYYSFYPIYDELAF